VRPCYDLHFSPLSLARAAAALIAIGEARAGGIFHASAAADISYADAARHFAASLGAPAALVQPRASGALRGPGWGYSCLSAGRLEALSGWAPPCPYAELSAAYGLRAWRRAPAPAGEMVLERA
jgi:dTDP-4-dehydrorhamnose reductase